ncbi:alpha-tubulin N-acetyltransferase 1 isoform 3-T3 [Odontesthes bonariensis]|uniref:alpha-tubulin N-acetyltransferase 1 isoform X3 n=1 Tax=Odontesthes bonariensis TaxID=219752 RepID=UPI003F589D77
MEFPFDVNQLFSERISVLDHNLVAGCKSAGRADLQAHIATVIDELGRASAKAQQLPAAITSASKLQSQKHQLYLLKAGESSGGREVVVGFLKVGYKKLFLLDRHGVHVEAEPLCVLDFYVAENLQRYGHGLELFDFMLQHKSLKPVLMAYDRPSPKFLSFLGKHYCLTQSVPQVNNFVVFDGFFLNKAVVRQEQRTRPWPFAPPHSPQLYRPLSVESSPSRATPRSPRSFSPGVNKNQNTQSPVIERCRERRSSQGGLAARSSLYSRHMDSRAVGLLNRHLPGLGPVADQTYAPGYTDTHRLASIHTTLSRSQHLCSPLLHASERNGRDRLMDAGAAPCGSAGSRLMDAGAAPCGSAGSRLMDAGAAPCGSAGSRLMDAGAAPCGSAGSRLMDAGAAPCGSAGSRLMDAGAAPCGSAGSRLMDAGAAPCGSAGSRLMDRQQSSAGAQQPPLLETGSARNGPGWSWTVGENCSTLQWVKQKQEYRSTRPW